MIFACTVYEHTTSLILLLMYIMIVSDIAIFVLKGTLNSN